MPEGEESQRELELEGASRRPSRPPPVQPWQYDTVSTAILNAGTISIVAAAWWVVEKVLALTGSGGLWITVVRIVFAVAFVVTSGFAVLVDILKFFRRRIRDFNREAS